MKYSLPRTVSACHYKTRLTNKKIMERNYKGIIFYIFLKYVPVNSKDKSFETLYTCHYVAIIVH